MEKKMKYGYNFIPAKKLATNQCYTLTVNDFGDLYSWGSNKDGRLGQKMDSKVTKGDVIENARKYDFFSNKYMKVVEVSCGASHIAVLATNKNEAQQDSGSVFTWGLPLYGRLGYLNEDEEGKNLNENEMMNYKTVPRMVNVPDKVVRIACGFDFTACITVRGQLYTWGTNKSGYLGVENITYDGDQAIVTTPTLVKSLVNKIVIQVVCGSKHMMCLTSERTVFSWGSGDNGILGHGNTYGLNKPEIIKELKNDEIIFIAAGDFSSAAINNHGHLYMWGRGKYGILGVGSEENVTSPKRVQDSIIENEKVFYAALGFYHTICSTIDGKTFSWGYSEKGRLGCVDKADCDQKKRILSPREINTLRGNTISQLYAGHYHSFAIAVNGGKLWGWGENVDFVLGAIDEENEDNNINNQAKKKAKKTTFYKPTELKVNKNLVRISGGIQDLYEAYFYYAGRVGTALKISDKGKVKKIACGGSHTLLLTTQEEVYVWGYGEDGQLGLKDIKYSSLPTKIDFGADRKIIKVYAGYSHSMAITKTFEVFVWGDGKVGQLGRAITSSSEPLVIDDLSGRDIKKGACGYDNCAAITNDGKLYIWGGNNSFKLGIPNGHNEYETGPRLVESLNSVKKISLGMSHTAAINSNGELYTWGHGFYGQLGHGDILTKKEPLKVDHNDLKYIKVKCGSYQTVALDKKFQVYVWGRGGINLNQDPDKHKKLPEAVEDFKSQKVFTIQAGSGNSLVLTSDHDVYGWGDNTDGKCGGEGKTVSKSAKEIKIENEQRKKVPIGRIFAGYSHCFAVAQNGDLYGWGSSKCFRLTSDYGETQEIFPKLINLFSHKSNNNSSSNNDNEKSKKNQIDERYILARLDDKTPITNFKELLILIENDDIKYSDERQINKDQELQNQIMEGLIKISSNTENISTDKYIHFDKLLVLRMRKINIPIKKIQARNIPSDISNNITEIEKIYTMFYLHPCFFRDYFEDEITPANFKDFLGGIKPLFADLQSYSQKSESLDNVIYLSFFKILIEYDLRIYKKDIEKLYSKLNSFSELIIESYFYNSYGKSILLDIFEKSLKELYTNSLNHVRKNKLKNKSKEASTELLSTFKALKSMFFNSKGNKEDRENIKKENIEEIINMLKSFLNDFESNMSKLPIYVSYCMTKIKKKFYKILITGEDKEKIKKDKESIKRGLLKLFYKNILARLLKKLIGENKEFIKGQLNIKDEGEDGQHAQKIFEYNIMILAEFLEKICQNKFFNINEDREDSELIYLLNTNIKDFYVRINEIFKTKLIKSKYDLKKEIVSSIIYNNATNKIKNIKVTLKELVDFLKVLNKARHKSRQVLGILDFSEYKVFNIFEPELYSLKSDIKIDQSLKVSIFIDIRFLLDPYKFSTKYSNELRFSTKQKDAEISRCKLCNLIVPGCCILSTEKRDMFLVRSFASKIKSPYLQFICEVLRDKAFPKETNIYTIKDILNAVRDVAEKKQKETNDSARIVRSAIEDLLNKTDMTEEEQFKSLLAEIFQHMKTQHKHNNFINKVSKVLNDIEDATTSYVSKIQSFNHDMDMAIESVSSMTTSLEFFDDNEDIIKAKQADLTTTKLSLRKYPSDHTRFRYKMLEQTVSLMKQNKILLEISLNNISEKDLLIQIISNTTKKIFDLTILAKKNKEVLTSYPYSYEDYVYNSLSSNCFSTLSFNGFGTFNTSLFIELIHNQINDFEG